MSTMKTVHTKHPSVEGDDHKNAATGAAPISPPPPPTPTRYPTGDQVPFPYARPYPQQVALMNALLQSLQQQQRSDVNQPGSGGGALFLLESPTGTGKSLSLAAASLAWLTYQEHRDLAPLLSPTAKAAATATHPDWIDAWESPEERETRDRQNRIRQQAQQARQALAVALERIRPPPTNDPDRSVLGQRKRILQQVLQQQQSSSSLHRRKQRSMAAKTTSNTQHHDPWALEDYHEEEQAKTESSDEAQEYFDAFRGNRRTKGMVLSYESDQDVVASSQKKTTSKQSTSAIHWLQGTLLDGSLAAAKVGSPVSTNNNTVGGVTPGTGVRKIVYAARTHSQLSQFVREIRRIPTTAAVRCVALGGRKALCGHTALRHKPDRQLNDACLDLQKGSRGNTAGTKRKTSGHTSGTAAGGCPLLASRDNVATLALHMLTEPTDIEAAAALGEASQTCAYYASRSSLAAAQVVVLPYSMLLSATARQSVGLSLHGSLVLVDEAHNLPEALRGLHATPLSLTVVQAALGQLDRYIPKYKDRLAGRNLVFLGQLRKTLLTFQKQLQKASSRDVAVDNPAWAHMLSVEEFLFQLRLQNTNFFKLLRYLETSRLSQKLLGFMQAQEESRLSGDSGITPGDYLSKHVSAMSLVEAFFAKLTTANGEGKIVLEKGSAERSPTFRYVLLDPANFLKPILEEAHAVALVGGTLRPFAHVASELLVDTELQALAAQADQSLCTQSNGKSISSVSYTQINERFTAFSCGHVVSSERVFLRCLSHGPTGQELDLRHASRGQPNTMDELGRALERIVRSVPKGGIVVFIGSYSYEAALVKHWKSQGLWEDLQKHMPVFREPTKSRDVDRTLTDYSKSAASTGALLLSVIGGKMSEGINFADDMARCVVIVGLPYPDLTDPVLKEKMAALDRSSNVGITGKAYYRNLCMRAVNQSVGRAIRHANDYAAILLLDVRYTTDDAVWAALPEWLTRSSNAHRRGGPFLDCESALAQFFLGF